MPDDSLIDEMRAALRGDRERAEQRHQSAESPSLTGAAGPSATADPDDDSQPAAAPGPGVEPPVTDTPQLPPRPAVTLEEPAPRGLLARLALLRSRR